MPAALRPAVASIWWTRDGGRVHGPQLSVRRAEGMPGVTHGGALERRGLLAAGHDRGDGGVRRPEAKPAPGNPVALAVWRRYAGAAAPQSGGRGRADRDLWLGPSP